ncbi:MAG TPA: hypothetical protein VHW09_15555 [Bryobacteraceae bacterium]|jgi:hypothetical protein|nr:hypothetical protein [Bryobacteraceae bacterium]
MSSSAIWDKAIGDAKKVLGNSAKINDKRMQAVTKDAIEASKLWDALGVMRDAMKKKVFEIENADSKVKNGLSQAYDEITGDDFGLDDSKPEDKKKIVQATAIFDKFFDDAQRIWRTTSRIWTS